MRTLVENIVMIMYLCTQVVHVRAPEVLEGNGYDSKCDVWSLGCVLYEIAAMSPPFVGSAVGAVVYQILEKQPPQLPERFSQEFHDLVNSLLTKDPSVSAFSTMIMILPYT